MTDKTASKETRDGRLYYDDTCSFCRNWISRVLPLLRKLAVNPVPFANGANEPEMRLHWHDGRRFGGAEAAIFLASRLWWTRPLAWLAGAPGFHGLANLGYRRIAITRHCRSGSCSLPSSTRRHRHPVSPALDWATTATLVGAAITLSALVFPGERTTDGWSTMWVIAIALWLGFKGMAAHRCFPRPGVAYLLWPGMDANAFIRRVPPKDRAFPRRDFLAASFFFLGGLLLIGIPFFLTIDGLPPVTAGWMGMIGLVCILHFGSFAFLAIFWNRVGFPVTPLMNAPWRAASLANFWGDRWNRAFSLIARIALFRPLVRRLGVTFGTFAGFLFSGIAHELVISLPSRAGWGWPTIYFLVQGVGVIAERLLFKGSPRPFAHRVFTWAVILLPAPLLFHPPFLETVITPGFTALAGHLRP